MALWGSSKSGVRPRVLVSTVGGRQNEGAWGSGESLMRNRVSGKPGRSGENSRYMPGPTHLLYDQVVVKQYGSGANAVTALRHVNLIVSDGQFIAIRGRSGAGKTTLLNIVAGLDNPSSGRVMLFERDLGQLSEGQRTQLRR